MSEQCSWCLRPVVEAGDTCTYGCYLSYYGWLYAMNNGRNDELVRLQPDDRPPRPLIDQPWYARQIELEDYA